MFRSKRGLIISFLCILIIIAILIFVTQMKISSQKWIALRESKLYENFLDSDIKEMSLQKSFTTKVTFSDDDLIDEWENFFETLKICKYRKKLRKDEKLNGGGLFVEVITDNTTNNFSFIIPADENDFMLEIDGYFYKFTSEEENPFDHVYSIAKDRHGETNLWE